MQQEVVPVTPHPATYIQCDKCSLTNHNMASSLKPNKKVNIVSVSVQTFVFFTQDVFKDLRSKDGNFPKEKVAQALRCLGFNPLQEEVACFINKTGYKKVF